MTRAWIVADGVGCCATVLAVLALWASALSLIDPLWAALAVWIAAAGWAAALLRPGRAGDHRQEVAARLRTFVNRLHPGIPSGGGRLASGAFLTAVAVAIAALWMAVHRANPFIGHDEAVYANKARSWISDLPDAGWQPYRPPGLPLLGAPALELHGDLITLRLLALALTVATVATYFVLGARLTSRPLAAAATLAVLAGAPFQRRIAEFLNDIVAAGLLFAVAYLLVRYAQMRRAAAIVGAAALGVLVFYLRYGALLGLLALLVAAVVAYGVRPWTSRWRLTASVIVGCLVALLPHALYSIRVTGTPWGVLGSADEIAASDYFAQGVFEYAGGAPVLLAGPVAGVLLLAGLISGAVSLRRLTRTEADDHDRVRVLLAVAAVVHLAALGLSAHGEPRYAYFAIFALTLLGVEAWARLAGRSGDVAVAVILVMAVSAIPSGYADIANGQLALARESRTGLADAALAAGGPHPCLVVSRSAPQVGWYSACDVLPWSEAAKVGVPHDRPVTLLRFSNAPADGEERALRRLTVDRAVRTSLHPGGGELGNVEAITLVPTTP
jgi:hypothetical protein